MPTKYVPAFNLAEELNISKEELVELCEKREVGITFIDDVMLVRESQVWEEFPEAKYAMNFWFYWYQRHPHRAITVKEWNELEERRNYPRPILPRRAA